jgi:hypothetical protein
LPQDSGIRRGFSLSVDVATAVAELYAALDQPDLSQVVFFCAASYDRTILAQELKARFGDVNVVGCTTAGEITPVGFQYGTITGFSLSRAACQSVTVVVQDLAEYRIEQGYAAAEQALATLRRLDPSVSDKNTFALLLIDGMSRNEEAVVSSMHWAMGAIPLFGGSAGDDLQLRGTFVYHDGQFRSGAALLTVMRMHRPFKVFRAQHFTSADERMVVTKADPERRRVLEINGEPAVAEYARLTGLRADDLTPATFAEHPVIVRMGRDHFVRSIQSAQADGGLTFFCAIDEGVVLRRANHHDVIANLQGLFTSLREELGPPELIIGFDCVLRTMEAERRQVRHLASRLMIANKVIGFSTYGEQYFAMHMNQTFTGVAIGA